MHQIALFLQQNNIDQEQIQRMVLMFMGLLPLFILIGMVIIIIPAWFICKKAGFSPWLSLICLIPSFGLLILLYVLAFAEWPSQRAAMPLPPGYIPPPPPPLA